MFNTSSIALIVGGSSGMGKATAERLLKSGVPVMILSHDKQNLAEAKLDLESTTNGHVETAQVDLYDPSAVQSLIEQLNAEKRHIGYLVNAAGFFKPVDFLEHSEQDYDLQLDMNRAFFFLSLIHI